MRAAITVYNHPISIFPAPIRWFIFTHQLREEVPVPLHRLRMLRLQHPPDRARSRQDTGRRDRGQPRVEEAWCDVPAERAHRAPALRITA